MIIIILGAGACGIASFVHFLNQQQSTLISKERGLEGAAWSGGLSHELDLFDHLVADQVKRPDAVHGDAGFYHLNYVHELHQRYDGKILFVSLQRDTGETFDDWSGDLAKSWSNTNPLCESTPICGPNFKPSPLAHLYPSIGIGDQELAAAHYISMYVSATHWLEEQLGGRLIHLPTSLLDDEAGQTDILDVLGYPDVGRTLIPGGVDVHKGKV